MKKLIFHDNFGGHLRIWPSERYELWDSHQELVDNGLLPIAPKLQYSQRGPQGRLQVWVEQYTNDHDHDLKQVQTLYTALGVSSIMSMAVF